MSRDYSVKPAPASAVSYKAYIVGFILSLDSTMVAYALVVAHLNTGHQWPGDQIILPIIIVLALAQFGVQLVYFLHLGHESSPRWKLLVFGFMALTVAILVFGSLWIMNHLDYHLTPSGADNYIIKDEGIRK